MTFTFTIRISWHFSSAREFQMGNFQKYWSQNVGQDFMYLIFFTGGRFWKLTEGALKIGRKMLPQEGSHVCIWGGLVIRGPRYELYLTSFWKCLACADFIKDLIWRVQLLNAMCFFLAVYGKYYCLFHMAFFKFWYLLCFQCNVPSHRWKIKAQMKSHRWRMEDMCKDHW